MKRNVLFVTHQGADLDEGLDYALDLAKMTDKGVSILLVNKKKLADKFDDIMAAVTFAEANEQETARELIGGERNDSSSGEAITEELENQCKNSGMAAQVFTTLKDAANGLKDFLSEHKGVDMILLGPSITSHGDLSSRELSKLVKTASRPVVTLARNGHH